MSCEAPVLAWYIAGYVAIQIGSAYYRPGARILERRSKTHQVGEHQVGEYQVGGYQVGECPVGECQVGECQTLLRTCFPVWWPHLDRSRNCGGPKVPKESTVAALIITNITVPYA